MPGSRLLIQTMRDFRRHYPDLGVGDAVVGALALKPGEEVKLLDLEARGVALFPAALAQALARSKAAQAEVLGRHMIPGTFVAYGPGDLTGHLEEYQARGWEKVVSKRDRAHLGLGVSLWPSLETLYSLAALNPIPYPLVVQPFVAGARDVRVVWVGDYREAYERLNPNSFRKNLFQGGVSRPLDLTPELEEFCRAVLARGKFPYAIFDLLLTPEGQIFLSEITLKGGITGARLNQAEFKAKVAALEKEFCETWAAS